MKPYQTTSGPMAGTIVQRPGNSPLAHVLRESVEALRRHPLRAYLILAAVCASLLPGIRFEDGMPEEHYILQAEGFLKGSTAIEAPIFFLNDIIVYNGRQYISNPPFPAILLLPIVALLGPLHAKGLYLTTFLVIVTAMQIYSMAARCNRKEYAVWMIVAFLLGTGYWFCYTQSDGMWFVAHIVSFNFLLAALNESMGRCRGWILGLLLGASFLSRQTTIYAGFFLIAVLWLNSEHWQQRLRHLLGFGCGLGICVAFYLWFNWTRFGNPLDTGYAHLEPGYPHHQHRLFAWECIPANTLLMLINGFHVEIQGQGLTSGWNMSAWGTSLTFGSPFVFFAFYSRLPVKLRMAAWTAVAATALHFLSYHTSGWKQINCYRYALDFMPLLLLLCLSAISPTNARLWKAATLYSILLNLLALVVVPLTNTVYQAAFVNR